MSLLRDQILNANDTTAEQVEISEWGVTVEVRTMSGAARALLMQSAVDDGGTIDLSKIYPDVIIGCTYDPETGDFIFVPSDREMLMTKSGAALDKVAAVAMRLSGFTADSVDKAGKDS